jgi:carbon storage regulator
MLVLSRKRNEKVFVGKNIVVTIVEIRGNTVRLGFGAPRKIQIEREEVRARIAAGEPLHQIETDLDYRENQS